MPFLQPLFQLVLKLKVPRTLHIPFFWLTLLQLTLIVFLISRRQVCQEEHIQYKLQIQALADCRHLAYNILFLEPTNALTQVILTTTYLLQNVKQPVEVLLMNKRHLQLQKGATYARTLVVISAPMLAT